MIKSKSEWNEEKVTEYVRSGYTRCPICGDGRIVGGEIEIDGSDVWQEVSCIGCDAVWTDRYQLVGVDIVSFGVLDFEVSLGGN